MKFLSFAAASAVLSFAGAAPVAEPATAALPPNTYQVQYIDKFDDLKALPITTGVLAEVGNYHGLNYKNFGVSSDLLSILGLTPTSPPNYIYGSPLAAGAYQLAPSSAKCIHFELCYFSFACAVVGSVGVAQKCTILITGQKEGGGQVSATYVYDPALLGADYAFVDLRTAGNFKKLTSASITVVSSETPQPVTIPLIDNIAYLNLYSKK